MRSPQKHPSLRKEGAQDAVGLRESLEGQACSSGETKVVSQGLSFIRLPVNLLKCLTLRHLFPATIMLRSCRGLPPPCWVLPTSFSEQQRCRSILPFSGSDLHGLPMLLRAGPAECAQMLHSLDFLQLHLLLRCPGCPTTQALLHLSGSLTARCSSLSCLIRPPLSLCLCLLICLL